MKFTTNTKPLSDALSLGVINANISPFYQTSMLAEVTASKDCLRINLEAACILTEITVYGQADSLLAEGESMSSLVSCQLLKQLVSTFETNTVDIEYVEGGLILHSGKSKFTLPNMVSASLASLHRPSSDVNSENVKEIIHEDWAYIKNHMMYALSAAYTKPVYTRVWVGEEKDVLVSDMDDGLFTHAKKSDLGRTCLLLDTIVNLLDSVPEGSQLIEKDDSYLINVKTDGFELKSEFRPEYENNKELGSYSSEIILSLMGHTEDNAIKVDPAAISKLLTQATLLANSKDDTIKLTSDGSTLKLVNKEVNGLIKSEGHINAFELDFVIDRLKSVISNYTSETISVTTTVTGDKVTGIVVWDDVLTTVLAGME